VARIFRGNLYGATGEFEKAAQDQEEAIRLSPRSGIAYGNLMAIYGFLDRFDDAKAVAKRAFAEKLDGSGIHENLLYGASIQTDQAGPNDIEQGRGDGGQWFAGKPDEWMSFRAQGINALVRGQPQKAQGLFQQAAELARRWNLAEVATAMNQAATRDPYDDCEMISDYFNVPCGDPDEGLKAAAGTKERPGYTLLNAVQLPLLRAAAELKRNQPAKAIGLLQSAAPYDRAYPSVVYLRGLAYLRLQKWAAAASEFRKIVDHKGANWGSRYPLSYLNMARAAIVAGDSAKAKKTYQAFLELWKDGDPAMPILVAARQELAALR
jgi:tetratricopeptide (TPR) repeat protein